MDNWNPEWLTEEPNSESSSPVSQEPLFAEGNSFDVDSPIFSRNSNDSFGDDKIKSYEKQDNALLRTSLKNVSLAKKRLQAYTANYIKKTPIKEDRKIEDINNTQERETSDQHLKKAKTVLYPDDKAKAVIREIEDLKKLENEEHLKFNISGNMTHGMKSSSRSISPEVINHFRKREIKCRNYRRTDSVNRKSISPVDQQRRRSTDHRKPSIYPKNWREYKEQRLTIPKDEELKSKCFPKANHSNAEIFNKLYNFAAPSTLLESFRYSGEQQMKAVPISFLRFTKSRPTIMYSVNSERNKESYMSRMQISQVIPKKREELMQSLMNKQSKLQSANRNVPNRMWYNKGWKKTGDQVSKVIENSVGLSFLQNYSDEDEENETDTIVICSSVKKNKENKIESTENVSERREQTPPQPYESSQEIDGLNDQKEITYEEEKTVSEREKKILAGEERLEDMSEERLTPERIAQSIDTFENNDISLTPERFNSDRKDPLYETRMAIQKIERELEIGHLGTIKESLEQSELRTKKKKKKRKSDFKRNDESTEDGESSKIKRKKKKRNKKQYDDDDSPYSEDEKRKRAKKEKRKEKTKKKRRNSKDDSNKIKKRNEVPEEGGDYSKNKKKTNKTETKFPSENSGKKNKKKVKKEKRRRCSENESLTDEAVSKYKISDDKCMEELFEPKIMKSSRDDIGPDQDLRNLLQQLEKKKEAKKNENYSCVEDAIQSQNYEKIQDVVKQRKKSKKENYCDESYTTDDKILLKDIGLMKNIDKDSAERRDKKRGQNELVDKHNSRESSKKRKHSKDRLYSKEPFEIDNIEYNTVKIKKEHDWEDYEHTRKKTKHSPNILEDFPLQKVKYKQKNKLKGGTPDTDEYYGNWESDDEIAPKQADKPNTSWESDDEVFETKRSDKKQREYSDILDLEIPLNFKPFTRREPKIIQFELELPKIESVVHSPELPQETMDKPDQIDETVEEIEPILSDVGVDIEIIEEEILPKPMKSLDECSNDIKKSRWDKKTTEEPKSLESSLIESAPDAKSPADTSNVLENEYEEFMKAVSTTVGSTSNTSALNDSVITLSSDSNCSIETPIPNKKLLHVGLGNSSTPIKIDLSEEIGEPEVVIAPKDIPFIPMPEEVILAPKDIPFIPIPGEIKPAFRDIPSIPILGEFKPVLKDFPFIPMPGEVESVPLPNVVPESTTTPLINLGLLADITPVFLSQRDIPLTTEFSLALPPKPVSPVMSSAVVVEDTESFVSSTFSIHDTNMDINVNVGEPPLRESEMETPVKVIESPLEGYETPLRGSDISGQYYETIVEDIETPVRDSQTPVRGSETPVKGSETPVKGSETPVRGSETHVRGSEVPVEGNGTPVMHSEPPSKYIATLVKGSETPINSSDASVRLNITLGDIQTLSNSKITIEKPFSLVLPSKKTLVNSRLNFGDSDDEADKSKKTIDEIKMENLVELAEIQKSEKESSVSQDKIDKEAVSDTKTDAKKKERTRSRSPVTKRSSASKPKQRTERKTSDNQSSSKAKKREASPRRRDVSPRRRDKSPRRRGLSPRRKDTSPKKRGHSPKRNSPPRRRSSPGRRRYSSTKSTSPGSKRHSLSPRKKSPRRGSSPRGSSKHSKRTESTAKSRESIEKANDKKRPKSSTVSEGSKKSVADSTIPDESLLPQLNAEDIGHSPLSNFYKSDNSFASKQATSKLVDYSKEQLSSISTTYDNFSYDRNNFPQTLQSINHFAHSSVTDIPMNSHSNFVQVGNMVQIVPTDLHMKTDYMITDSYTRNRDNVGQEKKMQIVQVGNMLQIVPTEMPPLPPLPPLPPEGPKKESLDALDTKLELEKQSAEMSMKQKVAERRAERDKRRLERETRRKEKERRRREKEKDRQVKLKQKTENMIKRALELEVEGGDENSLLNETPTQWPPLPAVAGVLKESRGILVRGQRSKRTTKSDKKKNVQFADGIRPGEGTSPSAGEELSSPPPCRTLPKEKRYTKTKLRKNKKRKVKVKIIKSIEMENSDEDDNLPPPSPPPGSPPPHIFPSRIKPQPSVVGNILPQYVSNMAALQQPVQNPAMYRPSPMNVVMGHPATQMHRAHLPSASQRHLGVHGAEAMVHHHGMPPIHLVPPPPPPPPPQSSRPGTPLAPTHRNIPYHY